MSYDYKVTIDRPDDETPCECGDCGWKGTYAALAGIEDCALTPGDPSPAGRCPECDSLAYVDKPAEAPADLLAALEYMLSIDDWHDSAIADVHKVAEAQAVWAKYKGTQS